MILEWLIVIGILILFCLISMSVMLSRQLKSNREIETALYRLIEITKEQKKS
ncbi:hypothetical protein D3C73_1138590 [compost metagenome]